MKILPVLLLSLSAFIFIGCTSNGKRYAPDKDHEVYYKGDGVDEASAKKLAEFLKAQRYFTENHKATAQIWKTKDTFNVNFVYDKTMVDADRELKFQIFGGQISKDVFGGAPIIIHLCDEEMSIFKTIAVPKPAAEIMNPAQIDKREPDTTGKQRIIDNGGHPE